MLRQLTPGSRADIQKRLLNWCLGTERGLARVEYFADQYRQAVIAHLKDKLATENIPLYEIKLPTHAEAAQVLYFLREQLEGYTSGVVSISGFSSVFTPEDQQDGLSGLNFNRELWASFPLRQIWWFTLEFNHLSQELMPDLSSWFILRLRLLEVPQQTIAPTEEIAALSLSIDEQEDAKRRAQYLITRFNQAEQKSADPLENLKFFGLPALKALMDSGDHTEALALNQRLELYREHINYKYSEHYTELLTAWAGIYQQLLKSNEQNREDCL